MKLLLLSLLPLAADLAGARPAPREDSPALTRPRDEYPAQDELSAYLAPAADEASEDLTPDQRPSGQFPYPDSDFFPDVPNGGFAADQPDELFSQQLTADFGTDAAKSFYGLDDDEIASLQSIFTDDEPGLTAILKPGLRPDDTNDVPTAFLDDGDSGTIIGSKKNGKEEPSKTGGDNLIHTDFKAYPPGFVIPPQPSFDPKFTDFFDANGLPKVAFSPTDDFSAKLNVDIPSPASPVNSPPDYSPFETPTPLPKLP